jgi:single-strand DNA-binding protein
VADTNFTILRGNIVNDPAPSVTSTGKKVLNFRVATGEGFGEQRRTQYHNIVAWEALAEEGHARAKKGDRVLIEGHGTSGSYDSKKHPGEKVYTYDITAEKITYLAGDEPDLPTSF